MGTSYLLYNPQAGHNDTSKDIEQLRKQIDGAVELSDITQIGDYATFFANLSPDDVIILCGGDGTINRFVNDTKEVSIPNEILYHPLGTGNDFANDLGYSKGCQPFSIKKYIENLPTVLVNQKKYRFLNGVGYGIDGYCCEVGNRLKLENKKVNYTTIAIKGLLFFYKPTAATITVDGVTRSYQKVWLAPTMNGRYYGGGMMPTPEQDRLGEDRTLSLMILHDASKLKPLLCFPSIFKGEHVKYTDIVDILTGREITVTFDRPTALQIDGETILGVTAYTATSAEMKKEKPSAEEEACTLNV